MANFNETGVPAEFFRSNPLAESVLGLFESLPNTIFYAKDCAGRFVRVNRMFLNNHGIVDSADVLGKTDRDLHPPVLAEAYMEEDRRIRSNGQPLTGQIWLVLHRRRVPRWYISTKVPLFDAAGDVVGIAGAMYRIEDQDELEDRFQELLPVVKHIETNFAESISMKQMAELAGLSSTHFNRRFRQLLRMTPLHYLRAIRVQAAQRLLTTSSRGLAQIANETGFTDQSHFTKRFREVTGLTPSAYRKTFVS